MNRRKLIITISIILAVSAIYSAVLALNGYFGGGEANISKSISSDTETLGLVGYWKFDEGAGFVNVQAVAPTASSSVKLSNLQESSTRAAAETHWSNPANAATNNGSDATAALSGATETHYLKVTDFRFSGIPTNSTITGIGVTVERDQLAINPDAALTTGVAQMLKAGNLVGANRNTDDTSTNWPENTEGGTAIVTFGGSTILWGTTWSPSDINSATGFGFAFAGNNGNTRNPTARVDYIEITVYYDIPNPSITIEAGLVLDSSGMGNNGRLRFATSSAWIAATSAPAFANLGTAINFEGQDDYVDIADNDSLSFGDSTHDFPFSVSSWVNLKDTSSSTPNPVFSKGSTSAREYLFGFNEHNRLFLTLFDDTAGNYINATTTDSFESNQDEWVHVAATYDGSRSSKGIKLYKNGISQEISASSTVPVGTYTAMSNTAQSAVIARAFNNGTTFANAKIDEVRVYNKKLSDAEIRYIYTKGGPSEHLRFDEGSGGVAYDSSGFNNKGTLQNAATSTIWVAGKYGTALDLDGVNDFLVAQDSITASFGAAFNQLMHTGQVNCYDGAGASRACKGTSEDADLDATPKSYKDAGCGAGTVVDNHTGLCWQKDDQTSRPWDNALDYCRTLSLGEHSDWRLPTAIEAVTMLDYSCSDVANAHCSSDFNNNALNWVNGAAGSYWTSTTRPDDTTPAYVISASDGFLFTNTKTNSNFVRCVRQAN